MNGNNGYDFNIICLSCDRDDCPGECERIRKKTAQARQAPGAARRGRKAKRHECNGASRTLAEWAEVTGISVTAIKTRLRRGMSLEAALSTPMAAPKRCEYNGESRTLAEWAAVVGIPAGTIRSRLKYGWPIEQAMTVPINDHHRIPRRYEFNGASRTLAEWAEVTGIREITLRLRLYLGWPIERALTEPVHDRGQQRRGTMSARKGPMPQARGVKE